MYKVIGGYDMKYYEFKEMSRTTSVEKFNYVCIDLTRIKNEGKYIILNENKDTYIECICEIEAFLVF